jgi:hypothetical protein
MQVVAQLRKPKSTTIKIGRSVPCDSATRPLVCTAHCVYYHGLAIGTLWKHDGTYSLVNNQLSADCGPCVFCNASTLVLRHPKARRYAQQLYGTAPAPHCSVRSNHLMVGTLYQLYINDHLIASKDIPLCSHWEDGTLIWMGDTLLTADTMLTLHGEYNIVLDPRNALHYQLIAALIDSMRANRPTPPREMAMLVWDFSLEPLEHLLTIS